MSGLTWLLAGFSIFGNWLNIKKSRFGFGIWIVTNTSWMLIDFFAGLYAQSALFAVYLGMSIYGFWKWSKVR